MTKNGTANGVITFGQLQAKFMEVFPSYLKGLEEYPAELRHRIAKLWLDIEEMAYERLRHFSDAFQLQDVEVPVGVTGRFCEEMEQLQQELKSAHDRQHGGHI
ncbi:MAG: hypothetical protein WC526_03620 [Patescibacteria group bacterium]